MHRQTATSKTELDQQACRASKLFQGVYIDYNLTKTIKLKHNRH